ncbi:hypothetical protein BC835DRAFT_752720 [Cytidiella melzeri]|nr:hypothetical protein BC835DRAFT_752720 [Cytidiella melzeri]
MNHPLPKIVGYSTCRCADIYTALSNLGSLLIPVLDSTFQACTEATAMSTATHHKPQTVFIKGTSSGIGLACVPLFHSRGWDVVATIPIPFQASAELAQLSPKNRLFLIRLDVQDYTSIAPAVEQAIDNSGRVDLLVNNAGYGKEGLFEAISRAGLIRRECFRRVSILQFSNTTASQKHVLGLMDVTRGFLPQFRVDVGGGVIMISSDGGIWSPYRSQRCTMLQSSR